MKTTSAKTAVIIYSVLFVISVSHQFVQCTNSSFGQSPKMPEGKNDAVGDNTKKLPEESKQTFRFGNFGNKTYWTVVLQSSKAIAGEIKPALAQDYLPIVRLHPH